MLTRRRRQLADWLVTRLHRAPALRALGKRLLHGRTITQRFHGGVICLDALEQPWAWTGTVRLETWDDDIQDHLLALARSCRTMIDIGANIGTMSLSVALRHSDVTVVCVEPNARACALLRQSIALNGLGDRMTVMEAVAGARDGTIGFQEGGSTTGHVAADGPVTKRRVDVAKLIDESAARGGCLVKIDVEGYETVVLAALQRCASLHHVRLVVELHAKGFNGVGDPASCGELLIRSGALMSDANGPVTAVDSWTDQLVTRQIEARWTAASSAQARTT